MSADEMKTLVQYPAEKTCLDCSLQHEVVSSMQYILSKIEGYCSPNHQRNLQKMEMVYLYNFRQQLNTHFARQLVVFSQCYSQTNRWMRSVKGQCQRHATSLVFFFNMQSIIIQDINKFISFLNSRLKIEPIVSNIIDIFMVNIFLQPISNNSFSSLYQKIVQGTTAGNNSYCLFDMGMYIMQSPEGVFQITECVLYYNSGFR